MKYRSCLQQLLSTLHAIYINMCTHKHTDIVYLDYSKAFDSIPHSHLLIKLWQMGITGSVWKWFKFYLSDRVQSVLIDGATSSYLPVSSGVPQGSILGPLLFIIYINDLPSCASFVSTYLFADDTKCLGSISAPSDYVSFQSDLDTLQLWSNSQGLSFNASKCKLVQFPSSHMQTITNHQYKINNTVINCCDSHRDLGVIFSSDLTWNLHYSDIISKAYKTFYFLRRSMCSIHCPSTKLSLYISLIRQRVSYCSQLWRPHLLKDIQAIEKLQRRATKFILDDYISNYKDRLMSLKLLPLSLWFEYLDVIFLINCFKQPQDHFNIFQYVQFLSSNSRSSSHSKLKCSLPSSSTNNLRFIYANRVVRIWNALPVIDIDLSIPTIKQKLKSFLWNHFITNFNPNQPCTWHYVCPCSNCITLPIPHNFSTL